MRDPPHAAGQVPANRDQGGLQPAAGPEPVPQLAGEAPARGADHRGDQHVDRRPVGGREARRRRHRQPAGRRGVRARTCWPRTSRTIRAIRRGSPSSAGSIPERTGNDRTAILFQVEHRPGALAEAMNIFKRNRLNLTWIESFPVPGCSRVYLFFAEMEAHQTEARFRRAMAALRRKALRWRSSGRSRPRNRRSNHKVGWDSLRLSPPCELPRRGTGRVRAS